MRIFLLLFLATLQFGHLYSQAANGKIISNNYTLSQYISDSIDYSKIRTVQCKWGIYLASFKLDKKGRVSELIFSDSIPLDFKQEITRLITSTSGVWDLKYVRELRKNHLIVQPVLNELTGDCTEKKITKQHYRGIDSSLENELFITKGMIYTAVNNLVGIQQSFESLMHINAKDKPFLACVLLPTCRIKDKNLGVRMRE
jgi:hypothetical protein